ncbi:hypothetical protein, partial [Rhodoferax sp.]|uniref:hypothetical protein n=1 Tax=Rhodoferax sp. TaxID=50421 RepID=UPI002734F771
EKVTSMLFTFWVSALRTRLSRRQRAWGRYSSMRAVAPCVVAPTQTHRQQPTRARPAKESRLNGSAIGDGMD